jgi:hypothetical protein
VVANTPQQNHSAPRDEYMTSPSERRVPQRHIRRYHA